MPSIGFVVKRDDGTFQGELRTLTITPPLEIRSGVAGTDAHYSVWVRDIHVGLGWNRWAPTGSPTSSSRSQRRSLARARYANLGADATQPDQTRLAIIRNPE